LCTQNHNPRSTVPSPDRPQSPQDRSPLADEALDQLFRQARSQNAWRPEPVPDSVLRNLYALVCLGPTSANSCPGRFVFLRTAAAKERLRPALASGNVAKAMQAPVIAVVAQDVRFYEQLPRLFPHRDVSGPFRTDAVHAETTAFRNGTLQGAYLIVAARALGLDCGPLSGFDHRRVDEEFMAGTGWRSNFLCCLGYGDPTGLFPRLPRLDFDEACQLR
jgi:3-hydroxypropanoate dehydrogenase